jgi:hypothetical protein
VGHDRPSPGDRDRRDLQIALADRASAVLERKAKLCISLGRSEIEGKYLERL